MEGLSDDLSGCIFYTGCKVFIDNVGNVIIEAKVVVLFPILGWRMDVGVIKFWCNTVVLYS